MITNFKNLIDKRTNIEKIILYIEKNYDRLVDTYNKRLLNYQKTFNFDKNFFLYQKKLMNLKKKVLNNIISIQQINKKIQNKSNIRALDINNFLKITKKILIFYNNENLFIVNLTKFPITLNYLIKDQNNQQILDKTLSASVLDKLTVFKLDDLKFPINKSIKINYTYLSKKIDKHLNIQNKTESLNLKNLLKLDMNTKNYTFINKYLDINDPLIIPHGYNLEVGPDTNINFGENSYILLLGGHINISGTKNEPIIFKSINKNSFWKGIHVIQNENNISKLTHVNFEKFRFHKSKFNLTGGINFYKGKVNLENINIFNCISEDCINLIKTHSNLKNISIIKSSSDGIDFDFSKGQTNNLNLIDIGGDALDFSGSDFILENTNIKNAYDKGISNGEKSNLKLKSLKVQKSKIGIANKDGSSLFGEDINLVDNYLDIASYQKIFL